MLSTAAPCTRIDPTLLFMVGNNRTAASAVCLQAVEQTDLAREGAVKSLYFLQNGDAEPSGAAVGAGCVSARAPGGAGLRG
jgi:hypothetical protein